MRATISVVLYMRAPFKVLFMKGAVLYLGPTAGHEIRQLLIWCTIRACCNGLGFRVLLFLNPKP